MGVSKRSTDRNHSFNHLTRLKTLFANQVLEIGADDKLHCEEMVAGIHSKWIEDAHDIGMIELGHDSSTAEKSFKTHLIVDQMIMKDLYS